MRVQVQVKKFFDCSNIKSYVTGMYTYDKGYLHRVFRKHDLAKVVFEKTEETRKTADPQNHIVSHVCIKSHLPKINPSLPYVPPRQNSPDPNAPSSYASID